MLEFRPLQSLERLVATCNVDFGYRLLAARGSQGDPIVFDHFVEIADALVGEDPRRAAIHLAGLVALDVAAVAPVIRPAESPADEHAAERN